jgi:hypothetical protein
LGSDLQALGKTGEQLAGLRESGVVQTLPSLSEGKKYCEGTARVDMRGESSCRGEGDGGLKCISCSGLISGSRMIGMFGEIGSSSKEGPGVSGW